MIFLSVLVSDSRIHIELKKAQEELFGIVNKTAIKKENIVLGPEFYPAAVPISKSHITLFLFNADGDDEEDNANNELRDKRLDTAIDAIKEAVREYQFWVTSKNESIKPLTIKMERVGHFNNSVIFAKPEFVEKENFEMLWQTLRKHLIEKKFILENDTKQFLSSFENYNPHVTLLKMSRIYKQSRNKHRRKDEKQIVPRKFPKGCTDALQHKQFGDQMVDRIELLSMTKEGKKGDFSYYYCKEEFFITQEHVFKGIDGESDHTYCCSPLAFPYISEESTESDTEKSSEVGVVKRKIAIEKDKARKSVRTSMLSMLKNKLGLNTHAYENDTSSYATDHLSSRSYSPSAKNAILFVGGSLLTIAAVKILSGRLSK